MRNGAEILVEGVDVDKPVILTSFPGIGLVGTILAAHFITELKPEQIGMIESEMLPPIATLMEGVIQPPIRIYQSREHNFILIHSDVPIIPEIAYDMSRKIVDWAASINATKIFSIAGIATLEGKHRVFGAATSKELLDELKDYVEIFRSGTISGIAGSILNECVAKKFPGMALLGETLGFNPDPRAAAEVINVLNNMFGWNVNVEKLIKEAEIIEAQMQKLAEQTKMQEQAAKKEELPMFG
ncbi:proteasome assembly chaperone family protein [Archaeoglobus veneficus]|uniref:Proteasome assembly chaperone family protein n=1 Tax=Archaeoglobus veneficus (strain DSM 11195 / SNP6) TaxID=693661 RepID=F2KMZ3_ARCVS|nr:proteasome assembly chaperone family protein [Archaeoglobus veneficus]AEA47269.1 Conserved hypothetical protein CHP00061 [Archaeoglobus veneficus SNP6]